MRGAPHAIAATLAHLLARRTGELCQVGHLPTARHRRERAEKPNSYPTSMAPGAA
jgi:hypothetical protein